MVFNEKDITKPGKQNDRDDLIPIMIKDAIKDNSLGILGIAEIIALRLE